MNWNLKKEPKVLQVYQFIFKPPKGRFPLISSRLQRSYILRTHLLQTDSNILLFVKKELIQLAKQLQYNEVANKFKYVTKTNFSES